MQELSISDFSGHTPSISASYFLLYLSLILYTCLFFNQTANCRKNRSYLFIEGDDCVVVVVPCIYLGVIAI